MATKHTPGPWEYVAGNEHHGPYVTTFFGKTVCDCYMMSDGRPVLHLAERAEANARLIAAAPDLLAALMRAEYEIHNPGTNRNDGVDIAEVIRAAIFRATQPAV